MKDIPKHYEEHQERWLNLKPYKNWDNILKSNILKYYKERQCYVNYHL